MQAGPHVSITLGISWQLESGGGGFAILQPFNEYSLYAARNRLQIAIQFSLDHEALARAL
jgi:hypothetical protein